MTKSTAGRPRTTSRDQVQRLALDLFATRGFEETTLDEIAAAVGVSRRTLFRYYPSKNDIVWGEFSEHLAGLRELLAEAAPEEPLMDVVRRAVVAFNDYGERELPLLNVRMTLITSVPALQGHSMLRYRDWCDVIAEFVGARLGCAVDGHIPQVIANAALGTAMATYRHWITHTDVDLLAELNEAFTLLAAGFDEQLLC
jgi:TetR/AcrR family transcriptional regulator, regulator of mycofactocin system